MTRRELPARLAAYDYAIAPAPWAVPLIRGALRFTAWAVALAALALLTR